MNRLFLWILLGCSAAPAMARDTWLFAGKTPIAAGEVARVELTSGPDFPEPGSPVNASGVARSGLRVGAKTLRFSSPRAQRQSLQLSRRVSSEGIAAAWVELSPRTVERTPEEAAEYLKEIGEEISGAPEAAWREISRRHAKTYLVVGRAANDRSWAEPVGLALEIVPESDPTQLRAGDVLAVRVLDAGRPLAEFALAAAFGGRKERTFVRTDAEGRAQIALDREGPWLLAGTKLRGAKPGAARQSDATSLTLSVGGRPPLPTPPPAPRPAALVPDPPFVGTPTGGPKPYEEILEMKEAGASEAALLAKIREAGTPYSLTTAEIQKLRAAGVSPAVIEAMLQAGRKPTPR